MPSSLHLWPHPEQATWRLAGRALPGSFHLYLTSHSADGFLARKDCTKVSLNDTEMWQTPNTFSSLATGLSSISVSCMVSPAHL